MWIELNEVEQRLASYVAKRRALANRGVNIKDSRISDTLTSQEIDQDGMGAEIAVAKAMNVYPQLDISNGQLAGDVDLIFPDGRSVDVKSTRYSTGRLLAVPWKTGGVDLYLLVVGTIPKFRIVGTATSRELIDDHNLTDLGHGKTYALSQDRLKPIDE